MRKRLCLGAEPYKGWDVNPDPLLSAAAPIPSHAVLALVALVIGTLQLWLAKGTRWHRIAGWIWVLAMAYVAASALFISELKPFGFWFSPIHFLSIYVLINLVLAVRAARRGDIRRHRIIMQSMFFFALIVAGAFTFLPGRVMFEVMFGS